MMMAKVFENGRSQAVRLPKEYRFKDDEVIVNKVGDVVILVPKSAKWDTFMKAVDKVVPGFASEETLLYAPELKFYSNRVVLTERLDTNIQALHCLGDGSGWTRGLMMASVMGLVMGEYL